MSGIKSKNTKPELQVRKALHARGFRYRIHCNDLPGKPDMCLPKYRAVVFVNGCFWHGHNCHLFKWPNTRPDFWRQKIGRNCIIDARSEVALAGAGWRIATVWECALKGKTRLDLDEIIVRLDFWIKSSELSLNIKGYPDACN